MGTLVSFGAKSGKTSGGTNYSLPEQKGHTPPGWRRTTRRIGITGPHQPDKFLGSGATEKISQGGYVRWKQDDETDPKKS